MRPSVQFVVTTARCGDFGWSFVQVAEHSIPYVIGIRLIDRLIVCCIIRNRESVLPVCRADKAGHHHRCDESKRGFRIHVMFPLDDSLWIVRCPAYVGVEAVVHQQCMDGVAIVHRLATPERDPRLRVDVEAA